VQYLDFVTNLKPALLEFLVLLGTPEVRDNVVLLFVFLSMEGRIHCTDSFLITRIQVS
jgi:hypothetical protein